MPPRAVGTATLTLAVALPAVAQVNLPPLPNANGPYGAEAGTAIRFSATGSVDPDGSIASYAWSFGDGATAAGETAEYAYAQPGAYTATLTVVDDGGASASATAVVLITEPPPEEPPPNEPPRPNANGPYTATVGVALQLSSVGSTDADGAIAAYRWMFGDGATATDANPTHTYSAAGTYTATLTVTDDDGATASSLATIAVAAPPNRPPAAAADAYRIDEDRVLAISAAEGVLANDTDPDGNPLRAELVTDVATGTLVLQPNGAFTYRPAGEFSGSTTFTYRVSDGTAASEPVVVTIAVTSTNDPPVGSVPAQTGTENLPLATPLDLATLFSDPEGDALSFTVTGLPPGLAATPAGLVTGAPSIGAGVGEWSVRVVATDAGSPPAETSALFSWRILPAGRADLALTSAATPATVLAGGAATWTYTVANPSQSNVANLALTVEFAGGAFTPTALPAGCSAAAPPAAVECRVGPLAAGGSLEIAIGGTAGPAGDLFASATVEIADPVPLDIDPGNDTSTAYLGVGDSIGTAAQTLAAETHRAGVAADFDGDGHSDLAIATDARAPVLIHANVPDPQNGRKRLLAAVPTTAGGTSASTAIAAADFDADGKMDLVTAGESNELLLNRTTEGGPIAFTAARTLAATGASGVAVGDLDGDARSDIVFAGAERAIHVNAGGTWQRVALTGEGATRAVAVADLAGDALPEIVFVTADGGAVIYPNAGGTFGAPVTLEVGAATSVVAADFDGDGDADLAFGVASAPTGSLPANALFVNGSTAAGLRFDRGAPLGAGGTIALAAEDVDGNRTIDLVTIRSGGSHSLYANGGATSASSGARFDTAGATSVALGAIGADTRNDVIVTGAGGTAVFFNDGRGRFGLGDTVPPVVTLKGPPVMDLKVESQFQDPGATATDDVDGDLTAKITVEPPVDSSLVGAQTVTYVVADSSGNVAAAVTRTVRVDVNPPVGGGGGGAVGGVWMWLLAAVAALRHGRRKAMLA